MRERAFKSIAFLCITIMAAVVLSSGQSRAEAVRAPGDRLSVFVSILPQVYFLERVGGDRVHVSVMVGPGQSPATYEPRPKQMAGLSRADLYFRIGVPFESIWIDRISKANPQVKMVDTGRGIERLPMKALHHHRQGPRLEHAGHQDEHDQEGGTKDPHIWLSPRLVKKQAENIFDALVASDPAHRAYYQENLKAFHDDLDDMDRDIRGMLGHLRTRRFMVFHPSWGYFARDYGLEQVPIEIEGKEPSARDLAYLIRTAKDQGIRVIFVQKQFSKQSAEAVADAIAGRVVQIDPLSIDYMNNMRQIAETLAGVMK